MKRDIAIAACALAIILVGCSAAETQQPGASTAPTPSPVLVTPVVTPAPTPEITPEPAVSANATERGVMTALNVALLQWNTAAATVMADMNDPALDVTNFGNRTVDGRDNMRASLESMKASLSSRIDPALRQVLSEIVGSYDDKMTAIDDLAVAAQTSDYVAFDGALALWQRGIDRQKAALPGLVDAARPFLSTDEVEVWQRLVDGT